MTRDRHIQKILQRFPTEKYKQFSHQTRPFFTMATAVFLIALGWLQIVNFIVIAWILAAFVLDNVALTPIMSSLRAINHLANGRKRLKSLLILTAVALALISGTGLGYFVLIHSTWATTFLSNYIALTGCSPFLISLGAIVGGFFAHATHKIPLFWGILIGSCVASVLHLPIAIAFEVVYFTAIATAFFATVIAQQSMRLYYKVYYGHTNADGYGMDRNPTEQREFIQYQAEKFAVTPSQFSALASQCRTRISENKRDASIWNEYMGYRSHTTNSYKDIYHGLMNPSLSEEDVIEIKHLIVNSNLPAVSNTYENKKKVSKMLRLGTFFAPDAELRTMAHQFNIADAGVIEPSLLEPFRVLR